LVELIRAASYKVSCDVTQVVDACSEHLFIAVNSLPVLPELVKHLGAEEQDLRTGLGLLEHGQRLLVVALTMEDVGVFEGVVLIPIAFDKSDGFIKRLSLN